VHDFLCNHPLLNNILLRHRNFL